MFMASFYFYKEMIHLAEEKVIDAEIVDNKPAAKKIKKPLGQRFKEAFFVTSKEELKRFIVQEVIMPGVRDILSDIISRGSDKLLYGDGRGRRSSRGSRGASFVSYQEYYDKGKKNTSYKTAGGYTSEGIHWDGPAAEDRANSVLDWCAEQLELYERFTAYQFYSECGMTTDHSDENWGWTSIEGFKAVREGHGWSIYTPKPVRLRD